MSMNSSTSVNIIFLKLYKTNRKRLYKYFVKISSIYVISNLIYNKIRYSFDDRNHYFRMNVQFRQHLYFKRSNANKNDCRFILNFL